MTTQQSEKTLELVRTARDKWVRRLVDFSRRNNLLYYRQLKTSNLELPLNNQEGFIQLLAGKSVPIKLIFGKELDDDIKARLKELNRRTIAHQEERGLDTLFIAFGMATWSISDTGREPLAPIILIPVSLELRRNGEANAALRCTGDIQINSVLLFALEQNHGIKILSDKLLSEEADQSLCFESIFSRLSECANSVKGFKIITNSVLSNFLFQKMAMLRDLQSDLSQLASHEVVAALAGDIESRENLRNSNIEITELDYLPPEQEFLVLDADASQQKVIYSINHSDGKSGVIQGPPGTGKSQTITNLITTLVANGKRVLFVAEKRAALEVVLHRLEKVGLDHLVLDLHGADISRKGLIQKLVKKFDTLQIEKSKGNDSMNNHTVYSRYQKVREQLNDHAKYMHTKRLPSGLSMYEMQGKLLRLTNVIESNFCFRTEDLDRLDGVTVKQIVELLHEASIYGPLFLREHSTYWSNTHFESGQEVGLLLEKTNRLIQELVPQFQTELEKFSDLTGVQFSDITFSEIVNFIEISERVNNFLEIYSEKIYLENSPAFISKLEEINKGVLKFIRIFFFDSEYRKTRKKMLVLRKEKKITASNFLLELKEVFEQNEKWKNLYSNFPVQKLNIDSLKIAYQLLNEEISTLIKQLALPNFELKKLTEVSGILETLVKDKNTAYQMLKVEEIESALKKLGVEKVIKLIKEYKIKPEHWGEFFERIWLKSCVDRVYSEEPIIASFNGGRHTDLVNEFQALDRKHIEITRDRIRFLHANRFFQTLKNFPQEESLLKRELTKKTRHLSLRKLLSGTANVLPELSPCWMASPLSVSQLMALEKYFDIVIFDEASQVLPEDAIPAILRAKHAVVAGDRHQLPPTSFFNLSNEDETELEDLDSSEIDGFESIFDQMSSFLTPWWLEYHYRSRDEALIAFSNHHIYKGQLITLPNANSPEPAVKHHLAESVWRDGDEESASAEVEAVVNLVLAHARKHPDESLGVITMGIKHAQRIQIAIDKALDVNPDVESFFSPNNADKFFVKNLERVQGDERDVIILSIGYGKDRTGKLSHQFGPLVREGGERRLNVAITRARLRMIVVSSFHYYEIDPERTKAKGAELLRLYLQYASSNCKNLGIGEGIKNIPLNPFEADIFDTLTAKGIPLVSQYGVSRYRLDFAAKHPEILGKFVLAIECDGAMYHSSATARERDRMRQEHLEKMGWQFHRIWSTDWFLRREQEIERVMKVWNSVIVEEHEHSSC